MPISLAVGKLVALQSPQGNVYFSPWDIWLQISALPQFIPVLEHLATQPMAPLQHTTSHMLDTTPILSFLQMSPTQRYKQSRFGLKISSNGKSLHYITANNLKSGY